jgi:hypothetical protein
VRSLWRRPSYAVPCAGGLALAIAASAAVFSAFAAIELESMGFADGGRLAAVWLTDPAHGQQQVELSYGDWQAWRGSRASVADVALASSVNLDFTLFAGERPEHVDGATGHGKLLRRARREAASGTVTGGV